MKVSLNWLNEYVELPTQDPDELETVFANLGHEVEGVDVLQPEFTGVVIGKVLTVEAHPNADKVRLCSVDTGNGPADIICGAWNFEAGATVPVAVPGAVLGGDFTITQRDIRGVTSNGMICSAKELGLGEEADGIMVLDDALPMGSEFAQHVELPDVVFDLAITPDRPDAMSMVGLARDLAAHYETSITIPQPDVSNTSGEMDLAIDIEDERCRRFVAREVRGTTVGAAPVWMQQRLRKAGVRSISNVVDISNYVMLELGQPTHAFDRDKIADNRIIVRAATDGETLVTLDDVERKLTPEDLLVADPSGGSSLAGTMGGAESEVSDTTTNVLIECASWDAPTVLWMSRRHSLRSEASARFERGVDPNLPPLAADRMAELIAAYTGGTIVGGSVDNYPTPEHPIELELTTEEVDRILGLGLDASVVGGYLTRLGFGVTGDGPLVVEVPTNRPDVTRPIDLIEEVARLHGFDHFPSLIATGRGGGLTIEQTRLRALRSVVRAAGFSEAHTFSFHGQQELDMMGLPADDLRNQAIVVKNPLREEESLLRTTLLPGLLNSVRFNVSHGVESVALFEVGKVFFNVESAKYGSVPEQPDFIGFVAVGGLGSGDLAGKKRPVDMYAGTAMWRTVAHQMGVANPRIEQAEIAGLHPGRAAHVFVGDTIVGYVGELHPAVARQFELPGRVLVGEWDLEPIVADPGLWKLAAPSVFPPSQFDLSFEVNIDVPAAKVLASAAAAGGELAESVDVFDEFARDETKAIGVRITLRAGDRTLTSEEVGDVRSAIIAAVAAETGATVRGES